MISLEHPGFYNDLQLGLAEAQRFISDGADDRRKPAHHPVVASIDGDGSPQQRVMILREANWATRELRFHTDSRSFKIAEITARPAASVLIYDEPAKLQLRLTGIARVAPPKMTDAAWHGSTPFARRCYMAENAPGSISDRPTSGLPGWIEGKKPDEAELESARVNFAALIVCIDSIESLYLANTGHRRAKWEWNDTADLWSGSWLVP